MAAAIIIRAMAMKISTTRPSCTSSACVYEPSLGVAASGQSAIADWRLQLFPRAGNGRGERPREGCGQRPPFDQRPVAAEPGTFRKHRCCSPIAAPLPQKDSADTLATAKSAKPAARPASCIKRAARWATPCNNCSTVCRNWTARPATFLEQRSEPHLALGWALAARAWTINPDDALAAWLWSWLENQLAVLMENPALGPTSRPAPDQ